MKTTAPAERCEVMHHHAGHCYLIRYRRGQEEQAHEACYRFHRRAGLPLADVVAMCAAIGLPENRWHCELDGAYDAAAHWRINGLCGWLILLTAGIVLHAAWGWR